MKFVALDLSDIMTTTALSRSDISIIDRLSEYNTQWISITDTFLSSVPFENIDELLSWLRFQSVNKIIRIGDKKLAGFTVVKTWMYDPNCSKVFFTISPYLIHQKTEN